MQKITPCLWFDSQAEEAAQLYTSLFKNSKILSVVRYPGGAEGVSGKPEGSVMTVEFELNGQRFTGLNGGPIFKFTEAVSFQVECEDQAEVDHFWNGLIADGGKESQCGWLKDKFGLSWQIIPKALPKLMGDKDPKKSQAVMKAMLKMKKIIIEDLEKAHQQA
jgi:predicted 3-demethylubiquinone-9 3-methyltransferase (glyoxalase superfamily)